MKTADVDCKALLQAWRDGDLKARDHLFECLYSELTQVSAALLRAERNSSLSTTDLVNEAAIRLIQLDQIDWSDKSHFLALSARAMRRILIDHARRKKSDKRHHQRVGGLVRRLVAEVPRVALGECHEELRSWPLQRPSFDPGVLPA